MISSWMHLLWQNFYCWSVTSSCLDQRTHHCPKIASLSWTGWLFAVHPPHLTALLEDTFSAKPDTSFLFPTSKFSALMSEMNISFSMMFKKLTLTFKHNTLFETYWLWRGRLPGSFLIFGGQHECISFACFFVAFCFVLQPGDTIFQQPDFTVQSFVHSL